MDCLLQAQVQCSTFFIACKIGSGKVIDRPVYHTCPYQQLMEQEIDFTLAAGYDRYN